LLNHLENNLEHKFNSDALNIRWHRLDQLLIIEPDAISDLEIFYNYTTKKRQKCFIENFSCVTFGGMRMLRANFLQPPSE
jgi:DNA mismatch repair ATPase MutS